MVSHVGAKTACCESSWTGTEAAWWLDTASRSPMSLNAPTWQRAAYPLFVLGLPPLVYTLVVYGLDIPQTTDGQVSPYRIIGAGLATVTGVGVTLMSENIIEDVVKAAFFSLAALVAVGGSTPEVAAVALGPAVGSLLPFVDRLLWPR